MTGDGVRRGPVHQILILDPDRPLPAVVHQKREQLERVFRDYRLWTASALAGFIVDEYGPRVASAFSRVRPYAFKADLARYCLLGRIGGWYVDFGLRDVRPPTELPAVDLIAFRDRQQHSYSAWAVQCGLLYARDGLDLFQSAVDRCVWNIENDYYGPSALSVTGPAVLGQAVAHHGAEVTMLLGDFVALTPHHPKDNLAYVGPDGHIWALNKEFPPGQLGLPGANAYNTMWHAGLVYTTEPSRARLGAELALPYTTLAATDPPPRVRTLVMRALRDKARLRPPRTS